jgi:hypothetical protein
VKVVADVSIGLAWPLIVTSEPEARVGRDGDEVLPRAGDRRQLSLSGVAGYVICAPPSGERRVVLEPSSS